MAPTTFASAVYPLQARPQAQASTLWRVRGSAGNAEFCRTDRGYRTSLAGDPGMEPGWFAGVGDRLGVQSPAHSIDRCNGRLAARSSLPTTKGCAMLLLRTAEGWANRMTDVQKPASSSAGCVGRMRASDRAKSGKNRDWDPRQRLCRPGAVGGAGTSA